MKKEFLLSEAAHRGEQALPVYDLVKDSLESVSDMLVQRDIEWRGYLWGQPRRSSQPPPLPNPLRDRAGVEDSGTVRLRNENVFEI